MRSLVSLLLLGVALALLHRFTAGAPLAARATLALGALVVLAELAGRLAARWRLPRVSGFVVAGIVFGPAWLGLVRADEAEALRLVSDAAIALFALRAGLAMRASSSPTDGVARYLTTSVVVPFALTAAVVYSVHPWFPLTVHQPSRDALAVALVLGALTVAAAPGLAWATLGDAPAGPLGDTLLRLHVLRDITAVLLFTVVLALVRPLASAGAVHTVAFSGPLVTLGVSVVAGAILAWLASRYSRLLGLDPGIFLVAVAFGAALTGWLGPAEVTLTAMIAGLGLARWDDESAHPLRRHFDARGIALAAVAFALVGTRFDLSGLLVLWPWVPLLVGLRAVGLYWGGRWAGRGPLVTDALADSGWLGLISQAGVGVLLAGAGRRAFPEWGVSFEGLAVAVVAVHAVVGPICMRWALTRRPALMQGVTGGS
ncbi:MAG TPA: cation:proton antiporter [Gemmatimonadales bacterium]|jgi:Kef-type K+ transport system membrane component KefB